MLKSRKALTKEQLRIRRQIKIADNLNRMVDIINKDNEPWPN